MTARIGQRSAPFGPSATVEAFRVGAPLDLRQGLSELSHLSLVYLAMGPHPSGIGPRVWRTPRPGPGDTQPESTATTLAPAFPFGW